jgi:methyltransferase-like protein 6
MNPEFKKQQLMANYQKNWDLFYKRNTTNFFKDRHWLTREFGVLENCSSFIEIGCGVGNLFFPLLERNINLKVYCCDFSKNAIALVNQKNHPRVCAFVADLTCTPLLDFAPCLDIATCVFVLSAIPPDKLPAALLNIASIVNPNGLVLFRDYACGDQSQKRFKSDNIIGPNFYARTDGTFTVFFTIESISDAFANAGFDLVEASYVEKDVLNFKRGLTMNRVFIQAIFKKRQSD